MRLVDTHAHLYLDRFDEDREEMLDRARAVGVTAFFLPAIDVASIHAALELASRHADIWVMAALHPSETRDATEADFEAVETLSSEARVVAIGETGLDYYWDRTFDGKQHEMLRRHIRLAVDRDLPLVFHNREAHDDLVRILREEKSVSPHPERFRGIFHCFGGLPAHAVDVLDLGFHVGLGGSLTFRNGGVPDAVRDVPLDRIVLETDAPFLAPVPHRGKRNEPAHIALVASFLAGLRGLDVDEVANVTTANAERLFAVGFPD